jgi:hypothetical protein
VGKLTENSLVDEEGKSLLLCQQCTGFENLNIVTSQASVYWVCIGNLVYLTFEVSNYNQK